jgi:hypothetical protein
MEDLDDCQEKLAEHWANKEEPEWATWLQDQWKAADVWHLQRYQISRKSTGWDHILEANPLVISLVRENSLLQYLSWKYALHTQQFHKRQEAAITLPFDQADYTYWASVWQDKQNWVRRKLRRLNRLEVTYEDLQYSWDGTLAAIQQFLGLEYYKLPPYMPTPTPLDYYAIFGLTK